MKVTDPLLNGSFTKRMNRFLASIHIDGRLKGIRPHPQLRTNEGAPDQWESGKAQRKGVPKEEDLIRLLLS